MKEVLCGIFHSAKAEMCMLEVRWVWLVSESVCCDLCVCLGNTDTSGEVLGNGKGYLQSYMCTMGAMCAMVYYLW